MTALKREAIQLVEQMPEDQMPYVIQYIHMLKEKSLGEEAIVTPKMKAFLELEEMLVPISMDLDYDKELAEARDERYGYIKVKAVTPQDFLGIVSE